MLKMNLNCFEDRISFSLTSLQPHHLFHLARFHLFYGEQQK